MFTVPSGVDQKCLVFPSRPLEILLEIHQKAWTIALGFFEILTTKWICLKLVTQIGIDLLVYCTKCRWSEMFSFSKRNNYCLLLEKHGRVLSHILKCFVWKRILIDAAWYSKQASLSLFVFQNSDKSLSLIHI